MAEPSGGDVVAQSGVRLPARALTWRFTRAGGPGGQHVNTSDTRVELVGDLEALEGPPELVARIRERLGPRVRVVSSEARSQRANREAALRRLVTRLDSAGARPRPRRPTRPRRSAVEARLEEKERRSRLKASRRPDRENE